MKIKFGNECYTWFMKEDGAFWDNKLDHMIEITAKAGMTGIEPMHFWMGDLADPVLLKESLDKHGVDLAAIAFVQDWNNPEETNEEREAADSAIELLKQFPGAVLCTVQMPNGRHDLEQRR
ncbi:MAG TPA: xylose isomerase, partial [Verrucomicrobiales bacterium]|nr:xylose isomerase [Verrucomicrobiales bacterium]